MVHRSTLIPARTEPRAVASCLRMPTLHCLKENKHGQWPSSDPEGPPKVVPSDVENNTIGYCHGWKFVKGLRRNLEVWSQDKENKEWRKIPQLTLVSYVA